MATKFETGEIWTNSRGRQVEILGVIEIEGDEFATEVFAYRFTGGTAVFLREWDETEGWIRDVRTDG